MIVMHVIQGLGFFFQYLYVCETEGVISYHIATLIKTAMNI